MTTTWAAGEMHDDGGEPWKPASSIETEAMAALVRTTLEALARDVEDWLPGHIRAEPGGVVTLKIEWGIEMLDLEVVRMSAEVAAAEQRQLADLRRWAAGDGD